MQSFKISYPPHIDLARLPTPLQPLHRFSEKLGIELYLFTPAASLDYYPKQMRSHHFFSSQIDLAIKLNTATTLNR